MEELYLISGLEYDINISEVRLQDKMREQFEKNRHQTDLRIIDILVVKVSL